MSEFEVRGPYAVKKVKARDGSHLLLSEFWDSHPNLDDLGQKRGVYLFGAKAGKGYTPLYVGKATKSFKTECFNPTNREKYSNAMKDYKSCTPVMFFIVHPYQKGKTNESAIDEIETFLIQTAYAKNSNIQNVKKTRMPSWSIRGAVRNAKRGAPKSAIEFRKAIGL